LKPPTAGWLSLDSSSDDLTGFVQYVVSALRVACPDFGRQLDVFLGSAARPSATGITAALMNSVGALDKDLRRRSIAILKAHRFGIL